MYTCIYTYIYGTARKKTDRSDSESDEEDASESDDDRNESGNGDDSDSDASQIGAKRKVKQNSAKKRNQQVNTLRRVKQEGNI